MIKLVHKIHLSKHAKPVSLDIATFDNQRDAITGLDRAVLSYVDNSVAKATVTELSHYHATIVNTKTGAIVGYYLEY